MPLTKLERTRGTSPVRRMLARGAALAEGDVVVAGAGDVEVVGVAEDGFVAIAGDDQEQEVVVEVLAG